MPLYEYYCEGCKKNYEILQKISDKPLKKCEKCGGKLTKQISESAFHLKGTGWYKTDYAGSSSSKKESKKPEPTETKTSKKAD
ncbi:zinc ribbon domain-containing protein [bacterium]|nr:zinc ribbon domain-containing protein [bacterium]